MTPDQKNAVRADNWLKVARIYIAKGDMVLADVAAKAAQEALSLTVEVAKAQSERVSS